MNEPRAVEDWQRLLVGARSIGAADAPVTIIEFGDYECPGCQNWQPHIESILASYPDDVRFVFEFKHWPLSYHQLALPAARAAECEGDQGRFWEFHTILYRDRNWLGDAMDRFAEQAGVRDLDSFEECLASTTPLLTVETSTQQAMEIGAPGTPTVIVNGLLLGSQRDSVFLRQMIEEATR